MAEKREKQEHRQLQNILSFTQKEHQNKNKNKKCQAFTKSETFSFC